MVLAVGVLRIVTVTIGNIRKTKVGSSAQALLVRNNLPGVRKKRRLKETTGARFRRHLHQLGNLGAKFAWEILRVSLVYVLTDPLLRMALVANVDCVLRIVHGLVVVTIVQNIGVFVVSWQATHKRVVFQSILLHIPDLISSTGTALTLRNLRNGPCGAIANWMTRPTTTNLFGMVLF